MKIIKFHNNIQNVREEKGLTRKELAEMVGISASGLYFIEKGTNKPTGKNMEKIVLALGCQKSDLIRKEQNLNQGQYPINRQYIEYSIELIANMTDYHDLTHKGKSEIINLVYPIIYRFFEDKPDHRKLKELKQEFERQEILNKELISLFNSKIQ